MWLVGFTRIKDELIYANLDHIYSYKLFIFYPILSSSRTFLFP